MTGSIPSGVLDTPPQCETDPMAKVVDCYFTPISPWTYFGHDRLAAIARRHEAQVVYKPVDYGKIFSVSGGLPLAKRPPQRQAYRLVELDRWRRHLGIPLNLHPRFFPVPPDPAAKLILAVSKDADPAPLVGAVLRACWVEDRNIGDCETLVAIAEAAGFAGSSLLACAESAEIAEHYARLTEEAVQLQIFGAPTYVYRGELFWGQDRLDFLDRALAAA